MIVVVEAAVIFVVIRDNFGSGIIVVVLSISGVGVWS